MRRDSFNEGRPLRVAIIGGGIGGLFAALTIQQQCQENVKIDVYEQASEFKEIGAGVGLAVNAARLVHKVGLGDGLNRVAGYRNGVWISFRRFDNGEDIYTVRVDDKQHIRQCPVARSDLLDLFRFAVEERKAATLHTKKRFKKVDDNGDHVVIHFEDSTTVEADVVIGADGIHSNVRNQFQQDNPVYSGRVAYRATVPTSELDWWPFDTYSIMWNGKHRHFLVFPICANKTLNIVAFANTAAEEAKDVAESWVSTCDRKEVDDAYAGFDSSVQRLIKLMPERPSRWKINDREPLNTWHYLNGKVILLGDAAHASMYHQPAPFSSPYLKPNSAPPHGRRRRPSHRRRLDSKQSAGRARQRHGQDAAARPRVLRRLLSESEVATGAEGAGEVAGHGRDVRFEDGRDGAQVVRRVHTAFRGEDEQADEVCVGGRAGSNLR